MATTTTDEERTTTTRRGPRTARASGRAAARSDSSDQQYDLLTAALIGVVVGAGATLLLRNGPRQSLMKAAGRGARYAGALGIAGAHWAAPHVERGARWAGKRAARGAHWAADRGEELWDRIPVEEAREQVGEYLESARDAIASTVESELRDLRRSIRRQRKKLGV